MIYTIGNERFTAQVNSLGAELVSVKDKSGFEYLWVGDPDYWRGQAPVLFPIVGALRNGKTKINGNWYEMRQHGFARQKEFSLASQSEESLSLKLSSDHETLEKYPFPFSLTVTYTMTEAGLETAFSVENTGDKVLPFSIGGHPGFNIPVGEEAAFEDYTICFEKPETQDCPLIDPDTALIDGKNTGFQMKDQREIPLRHDLFYTDALIFENLNSEKVQVVNKKTGKGVEMSFAGFPLFGIWSARNDGPYVCLEPWTGCATLTSEGDEFTEKKNTTFLPAGGRAEYSFSVRFLG